MNNQLNISKIILSEPVCEFLEACANKEENYYYFPFYFKKVGDRLFEIVEFNDSNGELKHIVEQNEKLNSEDGE